MRGRTLTADGLGGVLAAPAKAGKGPRVVLTAHMDEIGFLVQEIAPNGFLRLVPIGGWPDGVLSAQRLRVWARASQREFIGIVVALFQDMPELAPEWRLLLVTGFLGGLTTFSTFSAEAVALLQRGAYGWALLHSGTHLLGSIALCIAGFATWRWFTA